MNSLSNFKGRTMSSRLALKFALRVGEGREAERHVRTLRKISGPDTQQSPRTSSDVGSRHSAG